MNSNKYKVYRSLPVSAIKSGWERDKVVYSRLQVYEIRPRNPVSLRNRVSLYTPYPTPYTPTVQLSSNQLERHADSALATANSRCILRYSP